MVSSASMRERVTAAVGFLVTGSLLAAIAYLALGVESLYVAGIVAAPAVVPWVNQIGFRQFDGFARERYVREKSVGRRTAEAVAVSVLAGVVAVPLGLAVPGVAAWLRFAVAFALALAVATLVGILAMGRLSQAYLR